MAIETAFLLMFGVAILTGVSALFTKKSLINIHAAQFQAGRAIIDFMFLAILAPFIWAWPGIQAVGFTAFLALIGAVISTYVTKSIRHGNIGEILPLFNFSPVFLVILAFIFLGERINSMQMIGIGLLMVGAYVLQIKKNNYLRPFKMLNNKYFIFIIIAMVGYSALASIEKSFIGVGIQPLVYLWWIRFFMSIYFLIYDSTMYDARELKSVLKKTWRDIGVTAGIGWVGLGMLYMAIPLAPISILIPIKRSSTLFSTIVGGKFFKEDHILQHSLACVVMLVGVFFIVM